MPERKRWKPLIALSVALSAVMISPARAEFVGHGGPVRAVAAAPDGERLLSGGFDQSIIVWSVSARSAETVLRHHEGAVNALLWLPGGRGFVTGGEDGRLALWRAGEGAPVVEVSAHRAPVSAIAISPDGRTLASGGWDRTVRLWRVDAETSLSGIAGTEPEPMGGTVTALAFTPDGQRIAATAFDGGLRVMSTSDGATLASVSTRGPALNALALLQGSEPLAAAAGADGIVRLWPLAGGRPTAMLEGRAGPLVSLAVSPDGGRLAAGAIDGTAIIWDWRAGTEIARIAGRRGPLWALAFSADGDTLYAGGGDRRIRSFDPATGSETGLAPDGTRPTGVFGVEAAAAAEAEPRGAQVWRACVACHTLTPDDGNRAGPTLHGVFGRRIGSLGGYAFSPALREMDIIWTPETVSRLFELGPDVYTPGTKMPVQIIADPADRAALMRFLARATAPRGR